MSVSAIILMLVAMAIIWGGLALAIVNLNRSDKATASVTDSSHRDL